MDLKRNPTVSENSFKSGDDDETSPLENELTSSETPDAVLASKEIAEMVNAAMEALPEELRQAITLREIEGLSYEEISEAMNCPIGTVRSRIFRAREAISQRSSPCWKTSQASAGNGCTDTQESFMSQIKYSAATEPASPQSMNIMKPSMPTCELMSALADGQLAGDDLAAALQACQQGDSALASWDTYHLIGDVLCSPAPVAQVADRGFLTA